MKLFLNEFFKRRLLIFSLIAIAILQYSCSSSSAEKNMSMPPPQLPVVTATTAPATTYQDFPASLEGKVNVEIRPQVEGYLEKIYVDEGAYVKAGQLLFKIDPRVYSSSSTMLNQICLLRRQIWKKQK